MTHPSPFSPKKAAVLGLLAYLAITVFLCSDALFRGRVLWISQGDEYVSYYSSLHFFVFWAHRGIFPLWNPLTMCGHPFGLHSITAYDLYRLTALFLDIHTTYNVIRFLTIWLKAGFFYFFLLQGGFQPFPSFLGGLLWMFLPTGDPDTGLFLMPLSFLVGENYIRGKTRSSFALFVVVLSLHALNSNAHSFFYNSLLLLVYLLLREFSLYPKSVKGAAWVGLPFFFAGGLTLFYFARMFELASLSSRLYVRQVQTLLPIHYPLILFPKLYESVTRPELSFILSRTLQRAFAAIPFMGRVQGFLSPPYVGILPVYLLGVSFFFRKRGDENGFLARFALGTLGILVIYLTFHPVFYLFVFQHLPFLSGMSNIDRCFQIYFFCISILTAFGAQMLFTRSPEIESVSQKTEKIFFVVILLVISGLFALGGIVRLFENRLSHQILASLNPAKNATFRNARVEEFFMYFHSLVSLASPHLFFPVLGVFFLALLIRFTIKRSVSKFIPRLILALFMMGDLGLWSGLRPKSSTPEELLRHAPVAKVLQQDPSPHRVMILDDGSLDSRRLFLRPQGNLIYGIATPDGYEQLYNRRYVRFYHLLTKNTTPGLEWNGMLQQFNEFDKALADFINVKYFVTSLANPKLETSEYEKIAEVPPYKIFRNKAVFPRAFTVRHVFLAKDEEQALDFLRNSPGKLRDTIVLEGKDASNELEKSAASSEKKEIYQDRVVITRYEPNRVEIQADLQSTGYVVLTDTAFPGWKVTIDDQTAKSERVDLTFRGVRVPAGRHAIRWVYDPISGRLGMIFSAGTLLFFLITLWRFDLKFESPALPPQSRGLGQKV